MRDSPLLRDVYVYFQSTSLPKLLKSKKHIPFFRIDALQPSVVALGLRMKQSPHVLKALQGMRATGEAQERVLQQLLRDALFGGVSLKGKEKDRFVEVSSELASLATRFGHNVLDATKAFGLHVGVERHGELEGLPSTVRKHVVHLGPRSISFNILCFAGP